MTEVIELKNNHDEVNFPKHYLSPKPLKRVYVDSNGNYFTMAIDVAYAWEFNRNAWLFNVLKYILRAGKKSKSWLQDLKKSRYYLDAEIADVEKYLEE